MKQSKKDEIFFLYVHSCIELKAYSEIDFDYFMKKIQRIAEKKVVLWNKIQFEHLENEYNNFFTGFNAIFENMVDVKKR